jgi:TonB family protein
MDMRCALALVLALAVMVRLEADTPALFQGGTVPMLPVISADVGGGEVLLEVSVDRAGAITVIKPLRETATFTERMIQAVMTWRFKPAEKEIPTAQRKPGGPLTERVDTKVLVAGVFRRPAVIGLTLGEPVRDVASASTDVPSPTSIVPPVYPPAALSPGVVLVEVQVNAIGSVSDAKIRLSSPGFDSVALSTARQWKFRPAKTGGANAPAVAYIVFGFPVPKD